MIRALLISALILTSSAAPADTTAAKVTETQQDFGGFETEAAQSISINSTLIVLWIFAAFGIVQLVND